MKRILFFSALIFTAVLSAQPDIKGGEYFLGLTDPGNGNGIAFTVTDGNWDEVVEDIILNAQSIPNTGSPVLINLRLKDDLSNWGPLFKKTLFMDAGVSNSRSVAISNAEYFFGVFDPGEGKGIPIVAFDGAFEEAVETVLRTKATWTLTSAPTLFNVRIKDAYNNWGPLFKKTIFPYGANPNVNLIEEGDSISVCANSNVTLTYEGPNGYSLKWFNDSTTSSVTFNVNNEGYYSVSSNLGDVTYLDSIYIDFLPSPEPKLSPNGSVLVCNSSTITISASGALNTSYQWYFDNSPIGGATSSNYLPTQIGAYQVEATDTASGCVGFSDTTTLFTAATITTSSGSFNSCNDSILLFTDNGSSNNYQWKLNGSDILGETNPTYNATSSGNYSVTVTNGPCAYTSNTTDVTINSAPSTPTITPSSSTNICEGDSVVLVSSSLSGNIWSTGDTTNSLTVAQSGDYSVEVTSGICTSTSLKTTVSVNLLPTVNVNNVSRCSDGPPAIFIATTNAISPSYYWSENGSGTADTTSGLSPGNYVVTVTDANSCSATDTGVLTINLLPSLSVNDASICSGDPAASFTATTNASSPTYFWNENGSGTAAVTSGSLAGNYTVTVTDTNSCSASATGVLTVEALPTVNVNSVTKCSNGPPAIFKATTNAISPTYVWGGNATGTSSIVTGFAAGIYSVTITDINGCSNQGSGTLTVNALPTVIVNNIEKCADDPAVTFTANTNASTPTYLWSENGSGTSATTSGLNAGNYTVTVTDANSCSANGTGVLTVNPSPNVTVDSSFQTDYALNDGIVLLTFGQPVGGTYNGIGVSGSDFDPSIAGIGLHSIYYTYIDVNGCYDQTKIDLQVDAATSISSFDEFISVFPNPFSDVINIRLSKPQLTTFELADAQGKLILSGKKNSKVFTIGTGKLSNGVYYIKLNIENNKYFYKVVKK
tara:strand:- start:690 stop:3509 length:2820 start_codon:yes stop_codon:yes gene_type:complete